MCMLLCEQGFHSYGTYVSSASQTRWLIFTGLLAFTKILGMDPEEAKKLCDGAVAGTKNKNVHSFCP
jgi:hypothetical protein